MDVIRNHFNGPVLGVVEPGVRAAIEATKQGGLGLSGPAAPSGVEHISSDY